MRGRLWLTAAGIAMLSVGLAAADPDAAAAHRARGLEAGFNLDHDAAAEAFRAAIAADPGHPAAHRLLAATVWIKLLWLRGAITVDDYFGQVGGDLERVPPPPALAAAFREHIERAIGLAEQRVRQRRNDADAHFHLGAAYGLLTTYQTTIEGRIMAGLRTGRRAYGEQQRAIALDPSRKDAGLQLGLYRYGVSTMAAPLRFLASLAGIRGGRDAGIRLVEEAAAFPGEAQTNARLTLIAIYVREQRYDGALRIFERLRELYPRNRLLWLETAGASFRAGRFADAQRWNAEGLRMFAADSRPKATGEEARWLAQQAAIAAALNKAGTR